MTNYLYHYTSVETLALILRDKTIRFSNLSVVDDLEEQETEDFGEYGRFCFVSCWVKDSAESIPLWNMYTPDMSGVRIRLPENPFDTEVLRTANDGEPITYTKGLVGFQERSGYSAIPPEAVFLEVQYTDNQKLLTPSILDENKNISPISMDNIGKFKRKAWAFQKEYRYKLFIHPWSLEEGKETSLENLMWHFEKLKEYKLTTSYVDLQLKSGALDHMEILLGPKVTEGQQTIVEALKDKYEPSAEVIRSSLRIK